MKGVCRSIRDKAYCPYHLGAVPVAGAVTRQLSRRTLHWTTEEAELLSVAAETAAARLRAACTDARRLVDARAGAGVSSVPKAMLLRLGEAVAAAQQLAAASLDGAHAL